MHPPYSLLRLVGAPWPQAWIFGQPGPSPARSSAEMAGSPRFLGDPRGRMPCSLTPVGLPTPGQYSAGVLSPLCRYQDDPNVAYLSRLLRTAFGLAVYASQAPLRDPPTQDSLPAGGQPLPGRASTCRVPMKGFRSVDDCLHRFPLSQAWPGAHRQAPYWGLRSLRRLVEVQLCRLDVHENIGHPA